MYTVLKKHERTFSRSLFFSLDTDPYLSNPYLLQFRVHLKTQYGYKINSWKVK